MARNRRVLAKRAAAEAPPQGFGEFFAHQRRTRTDLSLREFSETHGFDAGNLSKLERGRMSVPQSRDVLERYARALGIPKGSDDWYEFFDRAAAEAGRIPADLLSDADVARKLPVLFRALRDDDANDEDKLRELIEIVRRS
jgi:transcriptional regulator with XRE-family HTH domain